MLNKIFKIKENLLKIKKNKSFYTSGMTFLELAIVLSIFAIMSTIVAFNQKDFQAKVEIKDLTNDIALKIVEAQRNAMSGALPNVTPNIDPWKPAYGLYFDKTTPNKFIYYIDLDNSFDCNTSECISPNYSIGGEVKEIINLSNGYSLQEANPTGFDVVGNACPPDGKVDNFFIIYTRPNSGPIISTVPPSPVCDFIEKVSIKIFLPDGSSQNSIEIHSSGRIQIK